MPKSYKRKTEGSSFHFSFLNNYCSFLLLVMVTYLKTAALHN